MQKIHLFDPADPNTLVIPKFKGKWRTRSDGKIEVIFSEKDEIWFRNVQSEILKEEEMYEHLDIRTT